MFLRDKSALSRAQKDSNYMDYLMRNEEVEKFIKYVIKSYTKNPARFMQQHRVEWDDLYQSCLIGLFNGIKKLDMNLTPNEWVRYLFLSVQGEIRNYSRSNHSNAIRVSQRIRAMYPKYMLFYRTYRQKFQQDPSIKETMEVFQISRSDAFDLVYGMQYLISLNQKIRGGNGELVLEQYLKDPFQNVEQTAINNVLIETYMNYLNSKQKEVLYLYYYQGLNKSEIAKIIGCTNSMITKHINNAFNQIRNMDAI